MPVLGEHRRTVAISSAAIVVLLAMTGCSSAQVADDERTRDVSGVITVTDEVGRDVVIDGPVERSVVLNSYAVEYVNALGGLDTVVGTDASIAARWPGFGLDGDAVIAQSFTDIDYESVVALDPDVFILPRNSDYEETASTLAEFDIPVVVVTTWDSTLFEQNIHILSTIFGAEQKGAEIIDFYDGIFDLLDERLDGVDPVPVYFENNDPYVTFLEGSGYFESLVAAGGESIFSDAENTGGAFPTATVDATEILDRDPDVIILQYTDSDIVPAGSIDDIADTYASYADRPELADSRAAANQDVYLVNGTPFNFASKAIWAIYIATWLHPDLFSDVDPQQYLTEWTETFSNTEIAPGDRYVFTTELS